LDTWIEHKNSERRHQTYTKRETAITKETMGILQPKHTITLIQNVYQKTIMYLRGESHTESNDVACYLRSLLRADWCRRC
jgi:hypothetical protein